MFYTSKMLVIYFLLLISTINFLEFKKYLVVLAFYITIEFIFLKLKVWEHFESFNGIDVDINLSTVRVRMPVGLN